MTGWYFARPGELPCMTSETPLSIRQARLEDAGPIAELITQLGYPSTPAEMAARLGHILPDANHLSLVAVREGRVIGVIGVGLAHYYERNGRYARILVLSVAQERRGSGVGGKLLAAAEEWARAAGASSAVVNSGNHRGEAHAFYERNGYRPTGIRFVKPIHDGSQPASPPHRFIP